MIVLRRCLAVALVPVLVVLFGLGLVASRVTATVMEPHFYEQQLAAVDAFNLVENQVLPTAVHDFLTDQNAKLPDNLKAISLPTDPASEQAIVDLLRTALPPDHLQAESDAAIEQVIPYLTGRTDNFDIRLHLGDQLRAVAGHSDGTPSKLQQTWDQLDLARRTISGLVAQAEQQQGVPAGAGTDQGVLAAVAANADATNQWLDTQVFGAVDALVPYLLGDSPHFHAVIDFKQFPALAVPFASALHRTPEQLLSEGFVIDDQQINAELAKSNHSALDQPGNVLGLFRPEGYSITQARLLDSPIARHPGESGGLDVQALRTWSSRLRAGRWAAIIGAALLVLAVAFLAGRRWWSRLAWGSAALLVAGVVAFTVTGPVYRATLGQRLHEAIAEAKARDAGSMQVLRDRALDQAGVVADGIASRMATTSRNWSVLAMIGIVAATGWAIYDARDAGEDDPSGAGPVIRPPFDAPRG